MFNNPNKQFLLYLSEYSTLISKIFWLSFIYASQISKEPLKIYIVQAESEIALIIVW